MEAPYMLDASYRPIKNFGNQSKEKLSKGLCRNTQVSGSPYATELNSQGHLRNEDVEGSSSKELPKISQEVFR